MDTSELLKNIGKRTGGDIYLGVVGPVRVGKSTFIKHFMQQAVIPYIEDEYERARMIDELPQAGVGKTIMTTEPKFVPNTAANITFEDGFHANVRLVDCVGYVIPQAKGYKDEDGMRMVRTPWDEEPEALYEVPVSQININMPNWVSILDDDHWLKQSVNETLASSMASIEKLREVEGITQLLNENEYIESSNIADIDTGEGVVNVQINTISGLYQQVLKEIIGVEVKDKGELLSLMQDFSKAKKEYDTIASALQMVKQTGYGFASASLNDISLSKPEIVKQGSRYGVRLKAVAPSIHMIKVDVESSFEPIIGSKEQSEELVRYLLRDDGQDANAIWDSDIFGRKLSDLIRDGLNVKLSLIPEAARVRLQDILTKLVNKGKGNVIAIVL